MILGYAPQIGDFRLMQWRAYPYDTQMQYRTYTPGRRILVTSIHFYCAAHAGYQTPLYVAGAVWDANSGEVLIRGNMQAVATGSGGPRGQYWITDNARGIIEANRHIGIGWAKGQANNAAVEWSVVQTGATYWQDIPVRSNDFPTTFTAGGTRAESIGAYVEYVYPLDSISVPAITLSVGETGSAPVSVSPGDATYTLQYESTNPNIFTVDGSGNLRSIGPGTAVLHVYDTYGSGAATSTTVTLRTPVTGVEINKHTLILDEGQQELLTCEIYPSDATNKSGTWASSNSGVATCNAGGLVTAISKGSTVISVTTLDGGFRDECAVTVRRRVAGVSVSPQSFNLDAGDTQQLIATISPGGASDTGVTWSSSDPSVAEVSQSGLVTAVSYGGAEITVTTDDGGYKAVATVTVNGDPIWYDMIPFTPRDFLEYYHVDQIHSNLRLIRYYMVEDGANIPPLTPPDTSDGYAIPRSKVREILNTVESNIDLLHTYINWIDPYYGAPVVWDRIAPDYGDINRWLSICSHLRSTLLMYEATDYYLADSTGAYITDSTGAKILVKGDYLNGGNRKTN